MASRLRMATRPALSFASRRFRGSLAADAFPPGRKLGGFIAFGTVALIAPNMKDLPIDGAFSEAELRWLCADLDSCGVVALLEELRTTKHHKVHPDQILSQPKDEQRRWLFSDLTDDGFISAAALLEA